MSVHLNLRKHMVANLSRMLLRTPIKGSGFPINQPRRSDFNTSAPRTMIQVPKSNLKLSPSLQIRPSTLIRTLQSSSSKDFENLRETLDENHKAFHIFFDDVGRHNHLAHQLLASYSIGGRSPDFDSITASNLQRYLKPDFHLNAHPKEGDRIPVLDSTNWTKYLGDRKAYWRYLELFDSESKRMEVSVFFQKYLFGEEAREGGMLNRLMSGALHPVIHVGYGTEFESRELLSEGMAMACITKDGLGEMNTPSASTSSIAKMEDSSEELSIFSITALMGLDPSLSPIKTHSLATRGNYAIAKELGTLISTYCDRWKLYGADVKDPSKQGDGWWRKVEELMWLNMLLMGATLRAGYKPKLDFMLMHGNNAAFFLPSILPHLQESNRAELLHVFFRTCILMWIEAGRPAFDIQRMNQVSKPSDLSSSWDQILSYSASHLDQHVAKATRALYYYSEALGLSKSRNNFSLQPEALQAIEHAERAGVQRNENINMQIWKGLNELDGKAFSNTAMQVLLSQGVEWDGAQPMRWGFGGPGFESFWSKADKLEA